MASHSKNSLFLYHGTPTVFDKFCETSNGTFFTDELSSARRYAGPGGTVYVAELVIENPLVVDARGAFWNELDSLPCLTGLRRRNDRPILCLDHLKEGASEAGYDGAIILNVVDNGGAGNQYIAFCPSQIVRFTSKDELMASSGDEINTLGHVEYPFHHKRLRGPR